MTNLQQLRCDVERDQHRGSNDHIFECHIVEPVFRERRVRSCHLFVLQVVGSTMDPSTRKSGPPDRNKCFEVPCDQPFSRCRPARRTKSKRCPLGSLTSKSRQSASCIDSPISDLQDLIWIKINNNKAQVSP